jgi:adenosylhomocysteinase
MPTTTVSSRIADPSRAEEGRERIDWAQSRMPVLAGMRQEFQDTQPLDGVRVAGCLHVTKETAVLMRALEAAGAEVALCASNPLSTQDDVAAALVDEGIHVYAEHGIDQDGYYECVNRALDHEPHFTMDDGGDLVSTLHEERPEDLDRVQGGTEETTTGVTRFRAMADDGVLEYPIIAVNDAQTKHFFDNRYGTGQSTIDGIVRATSHLFAGSEVVVGGYGWCGRGVAMRAEGMGARVTVTEVDPVRALEAVMDGFDVAPMEEAAREADVIVTSTGNKHVVDADVLEAARDGCIVANAGHFDHEIDKAWLEENSKRERVRDGVDRYTLPDGDEIMLLGEGRLVNLACAEGHPPEVMDMSFANQARAVLYLHENADALTADVHDVPEEVDRDIAERKLEAMDVDIDELTDEQVEYLSGWKEGT